MVTLRQSAFSVPQALQDQARALKVDPSPSQLSRQGPPEQLQQQQTATGSLEPQKGVSESKQAESMVPVAKSVMQSSGIGCLEVVELLTAPAR